LNSGEGKARFDNHLKTNLDHIHKNLYLHPNDPLYYEKILRYSDSQSPEAHYMIGRKYEQAGRISKALFHYQEVRSSSSPYYTKAKQAVRRLQNNSSESKSDNENSHLYSPQQGSKTSNIAKSMLICLLLFNLALILLLFNIDKTRAVVSAVKHGKVGMEVIYETIDVPYVIYLTYDEPTERIENKLYSKLLDMGKDHPNQNIQLFGIKTSDPAWIGEVVPLSSERMKESAFVKAEYNPSIDSSVKIQFQNNEYRQQTGTLQPLTFAAANLVRTALQAYMDEKGVPPRSIENLVDNYPANFLSFIPKEVQSGSNDVAAQFNGKGGWVYHPHAEQLSDMFYPNILDEQSALQIPYEPVKIMISKNEYTLKVISGSTVLAAKPVGLGKNDQTPEGDFTIQDRVLNPLGKNPDVYGKAGLGMGQYAIHGTFHEQSIGANESMGCIRLSNQDMLEIFPLIPKGASVQIAPDFPIAYQHVLVKNLDRLIPSQQPQSDQTAKNIVFNWLG
jgi:lipoprotein-anchoring transpeptidase ErfK/SrfK